MFRVDLEYTATGPVGESDRTATSDHKEKAIWKLVGKDELWVCRAEGKDRPDARGVPTQEALDSFALSHGMHDD